ncbi:hypothetical protein B0J13DRAFT_281563 [Dactylonectria estremocensis]|uniref:Uncharacterized protein n=1 Tax=Dactylonectria estremocensis TaxID=1079267 RepID=A0A9P9F0G2_9HYPO|nr:hypothetical protein B0J13DRAFT_281563 [Dactylonectria estremocensis]
MGIYPLPYPWPFQLFLLFFFILTLFRTPWLKNRGVQLGRPALHIAVSFQAPLSFGAMGGAIFDLSHIFIISLGFMPGYEEDELDWCSVACARKKRRTATRDMSLQCQSVIVEMSELTRLTPNREEQIVRASFPQGRMEAEIWQCDRSSGYLPGHTPDTSPNQLVVISLQPLDGFLSGVCFVGEPRKFSFRQPR